MEFSKSMAVAAAGLKAQSGRMRIIAGLGGSGALSA